MSQNLLHANDEHGVYPDSYYTASTSLLPPFPLAQGTLKTDVCIIGGGYSGLSCAIELKQRGYQVILLEAHRVGWGASGRNGGQLGFGQRRDQDDLENMLGQDDAKNLWVLAEDAKALVHELAKKYHIDYEYRAGLIHANHRSRLSRKTAAYVEKLQTRYAYDSIEFLDHQAICEHINSRAYYSGIYDHKSGHIHPLKFALGLARTADRLGVQIYEKSEVQHIENQPKPSVRTSQAQIKCKYVLLACNGYIGRLNRAAARQTMPIHNYIISTETLRDERAYNLIAKDAAVADSKFVINYFRYTHDRRLLFGGRESYKYPFPKDIKSFVRKPMLDIFPQLKDVKIDYGWGGTLAITRSRMPHIGWAGDDVLCVSGYSGHGVSMATLCGKLAAQAIAGQAEQFNLMAKVPTPAIPVSSLIRVPLLTLAMFAYSLRDKI